MQSSALRLTSIAVICSFALLGSAQVKVTSVVGGAINDGQLASAAAFELPAYAATDSAGNVYVTDQADNRIRKINTAGKISTYAGTGIAGFGGDAGPAKSALLNSPNGIAVDNGGSVFFCDNGNYRIRKIDPNGVISTIAGTGTAGNTGDGSKATSARLGTCRGVAVDATGNVFFADSQFSVVRKIDTLGVIRKVGGTGTAGFSGDGGPAKSAQLNQPQDVAVSPAGLIYIADANNLRIRVVNAAGNINTFAGVGGGVACSGDGGTALSAGIGRPQGLLLANGTLFLSAGCSRVRSINLTTNVINTVVCCGITDGFGGFNGDGHAPLSTELFGPRGLTLDKTGALLIVDSVNKRVRKVGDVISTFAGGYLGDGHTGLASSLNIIGKLAFDSTGNLFVGDVDNYRIRKLSTTGVVNTSAGNGLSIYSGDGGQAIAAGIRSLQGIAVDSTGNLYFADRNSAIIRKVDSSGNVQVFASDPSFQYLSALAIDKQDNILAADAFQCLIFKITPAGSVSIFAGVPGFCSFNGDGLPARQSSFNGPQGLSVDTNGNVYVADTDDSLVRKIDTNLIVTTVAGNGACWFSGDGGRATDAALCEPYAAVADHKGNVYIADWLNSRIRMVNPAGFISTVAGTGNFAAYNGNGLLAGQTNIFEPMDIVVSPKGIVYFSDAAAYRVRKITGTPLAKFNTSTLNFSSQTVTTSKSLRAVFKYSGAGTLTLQSLLPSTGPFTVDTVGVTTGACNLAGTTLLVAGQSCSFNVKFSPITKGKVTAVITATYSGSADATTSTMLSLIGTGR